jgi:di/tricarboxylate transporter
MNGADRNIVPRVIAGLVCLIGAAVYLSPAPEGANPGVMKAAGVVVFAIGLWATAAVPEFFTSIVFFLLAVTLGGVAPETVFAGFHSTAGWMVFGGLIIGAAVQTTGLGSAVARRLQRYFGKSYFSIIAGIVVVGALMAFVVPANTARMVILIPIFAAFADRLGFAPGSNGRVGIVLAACTGTFYPGFGILPAGVPNMVLLGAAESVHDIHLTYGRYFLLNFPVIGVVSILSLPILITALFPDRPRPRESNESGPIQVTRGRTLAAVLLVALGFWITDFLHGISPAWVALGAAVYCLLPRLGVLPTTALIERINLGPWLFVVGVVGMGAVVASSGLGGLIGERLVGLFGLEAGDHARNFASVSAIGMVLGIVATIAGQPAIMTALAGNIVDATGWPIMTAILAQIPSWSTVPFPYAAPALVLAMSLGGIRMAHLIRLMVAIAVLFWIVVMPLQFLWWRYLGMFG